MGTKDFTDNDLLTIGRILSDCVHRTSDLKELGELFYKTMDKYQRGSEPYWWFMSLGNFFHIVAEHSATFGRAQECVQRHHLGLGGENVVDVMIRYIDKSHPKEPR